MNRVIQTWYTTPGIVAEYGLPEVVVALAEHWPLWAQAQVFQRERRLWFNIEQRWISEDCMAIDVVATGSAFNFDIWSILTQ